MHLFSVFSTVYQCLEKSGDLTQKWGQRDTQKCGSHKCTRFCRLSPGSNRERMEFTVSFTLKYFCFFFFSDINECTSNTHSCYANATCQNTIGSHYCACMSGYTGNGQNCIGKIVALCFLVVQFCSPNKNTWSYALRATNPAINLKPMPLICWLKLLHAL